MRKVFHGFCRADGFCMRFPTVWKCCPKKMFLHLIFARVFSFKHFGWLQKTFLLIDLRPCFHFDDLLERCSIHLHYESNQSIEWMNRINEWKQWIEPMNRINESNQWIESLSRETRQEAVTIHIRWLSKPVLESHHIDLLLWIPNPPSVRVFCWDNFLKGFTHSIKTVKNVCQAEQPTIIPAKNPNRRGFSSFLFVLMSVSGGVHGDFLKPV